MLELKSLLVGLVFAVGVFAVKTGAGLSYLMARRSARLRKIAVTFGTAAISAGFLVQRQRQRSVR